jgi:thiosulfate/3-mercaptopyruvate sulfurtransferase
VERKGLISAQKLDVKLRSKSPPIVVELRQDPGDGRPAIPGAVGTTLHNGFAMIRPELELQYDLPDATEFAGALGRLGISPDSNVVLADDMSNRWATRVYWLLKYYGHRGNVAVLDGGISYYLAAGFPTAPGFRMPTPVEYPAPSKTDESIRITTEELGRGLASGRHMICDVRTPQEHAGEVALAPRAGHIPGSIHIPWEDCLRPDGTFLPDIRLAKVLEPYLDDSRTQVTYCQGGIRASLTWFALQELLGRPARLYAASWEAWARRPELPVEVGVKPSG